MWVLHNSCAWLIWHLPRHKRHLCEIADLNSIKWIIYIIHHISSNVKKKTREFVLLKDIKQIQVYISVPVFRLNQIRILKKWLLNLVSKHYMSCFFQHLSNENVCLYFWWNVKYAMSGTVFVWCWHYLLFPSLIHQERPWLIRIYKTARHLELFADILKGVVIYCKYGCKFVDNSNCVIMYLFNYLFIFYIIRWGSTRR